MAITILSNPQFYDTVYNEMVFTATSTNVAQPNFKYLVDIYISGAGTKEARLKIPIEPDTGNGYCIVDVHRVLESFLNSDFGDNTSVVGVTANPNSIIDYQVKFGEEYDVATVLTQFPDLTVDILRYAWNGSVNYPDHINVGYVPFLLDDSAARFLTNAPNGQEISTTDSGWLYYFPDVDDNIREFEIKTYDSAGSLIGTWKLTNPLTHATTSEYLGKVTSAPISIGALPNTQFAAGVQPVFAGTEASYTIQALNGLALPVSEVRTFNLIDACKYPRQTVHFLNELGGFDVKNFNLARVDSHDIERRSYKKNPQRITAEGSYPYSLQDRQTVQYYTKSTPKVKLTSDWITEAESIWLRELVESPEIYLEDENNVMIAVRQITMANYQVKTDTVDKLYNLEIELELSYDNYRQRG